MQRGQSKTNALKEIHIINRHVEQVEATATLTGSHLFLGQPELCYSAQHLALLSRQCAKHTNVMFDPALFSALTNN